MKKIPNVIFVILGIVSFIGGISLNVGDTVGFLLITVGVIFIGIGLFRGNNPFKVIAQFFSNFL